MGDRRNVVINVQGQPDLYFYTHWDGHKLPQIVQNAIKRRLRWSDPSYLARIIFSEMIKDSVKDETGYGISTRITDSNYNHEVWVKVDEQKVCIGAAVWSFDQYCDADLTGEG